MNDRDRNRERERLIRLIKAKAAKTPPLPPEVREAVRLALARRRQR